MQLTKEILFPAIEDLKASLEMTCLMLQQIKVKDNILDDDRYRYLFTVERVNELVHAGVPFRDAYLQVAEQVERGTFGYTGTLNHTHEGSIGNLCTAEIKALMDIACRQ